MIIYVELNQLHDPNLIDLVLTNTTFAISIILEGLLQIEIYFCRKNWSGFNINEPSSYRI